MSLLRPCACSWGADRRRLWPVKLPQGRMEVQDRGRVEGEREGHPEGP